MEFEHTTEWEKNHLTFVFELWRNWNASAESKIVNLNWIMSRLKQRCILEESLIKVKQNYFDFMHGIKTVNVFVLQATLRRLRFYQNCISYWWKLNRMGNFQPNNIANKWAKCHGCGMTYYLPTQYEKSYIRSCGREVMHLVDYIACNTDFFVCAVCVYKTENRALTCFTKLQEISVMYKDKQWADMIKISQSFFALAHLNNNTYPVYIAWFDLVEEEWCFGKIEKVISSRAYTIEISSVNDKSNCNRIICLSTRSPQEYFIYQRPSSTCSPLHPCTFHGKYYNEKETLIDTTNKRFNEYFDVSKMYNDDAIKLDWKLCVVNNGDTQECLFVQVIHMKIMYKVLCSRGLLKHGD